MGKTNMWLQSAFAFTKKNWFIFFAVATYIFFTAYYMGPSVWNCTTTVYGFGDNTAGPIWRSSLPENQGLLGTYTKMTNAPYGDNLYSPVGYSLILQPLLIGGLAGVAGPVCGYNFVNIIGFLASAMLMFGFILALTRHRWIALLSGYAVAFTPYYQMKVGGHPSYGYQALFIGLIWLFYRLIKFKRKRDAFFLSIVYAIAVYFDPYFMLYATLTVATLGVAWLILNRAVLKAAFWKTNNKDTDATKLVLRRIGQAAVTVLVLLMPLLFIFTTQNKGINESVAASRGNVLFEAKACSNWPQEYLVPFILHPGLEKLFGDTRYHEINSELRGGLTCGIGEDTVGLSLTLVGIFAVGSLILFWERLNNRRLGLTRRLNYPLAPVLLGVGLIGLVGFIIALPPVRFHGIPTPTFELLSITSTWRTLTRGYMLVNIALVILTSLILLYVATNFKKHRKVLSTGFVLVFLAVIFEYQAFLPFSGNKLSTFNYKKDVPAAYTWLKDQKSVGTIAEYPLERSGGESDAGSYYLTMQVVHEKKLFNSALSYSKQEEFKDSLKNISDPQTIPTLKAFGVDMVFVHGVEKKALETATKGTGAKVVYTAPQAQFNLLSHTPTVKNDIINVLDLRTVKPGSLIINLGKGFARNATIINSAIDWQYESVSGSKITGTAIEKGKNTKDIAGSYTTCFDIKMSFPAEHATVNVRQGDGSVTKLGEINGKSYKRFMYTGNGTQTIITSNGHNFRMMKLGCTE